MLVVILSLIGILIIAYLLFVNFYPSFGGDISKERQKEYEKSRNYKDGKFVNQKDVPKDLSFGETVKLAYAFFTTKVPNGRPKQNLEVEKLDSLEVADYKGGSRLIWYGHSAFLLQMDEKNILIDPMFGEVAAPHPLLGENRFNREMPLAIEQLPKIDAVLISHDHYDHLDYKSIIKLKDKVEIFYVPLGVGVHLEKWGIKKKSVVELDWWQEVNYKGLQFVCTPAQHFSGRKFGGNQTTLWSSWVIISATDRLYFSGDSGYGNHFKEIGKKYGPFDFAMMECGQYNTRWPDIHMFPEETAQAGLDVSAKIVMPIHWGAFKLALHSWTDPIERVTQKADELGLQLVAPQIGEVISLNKLDQRVTDKWW
ncbi:membrane protein [Flagellimonas eckloniae]|uniref:Membrane protein n=2 Tax=Flagellimonas eckloniae TaxID=346185 RepID=A0A0Q1BFT3_9FLAO|nr:membrane protein [Allomuricauda eckloniae]